MDAMPQNSVPCDETDQKIIDFVLVYNLEPKETRVTNENKQDKIDSIKSGPVRRTAKQIRAKYRRIFIENLKSSGLDIEKVVFNYKLESIKALNIIIV